MIASARTRAARRALAGQLAGEHQVSFATAWKAVQLGVHRRCAALAAGTADPAQAFTAATNAFAAKKTDEVFGLTMREARRMRKSAREQAAREATP